MEPWGAATSPSTSSSDAPCALGFGLVEIGGS
jgi:hypothetical protein